MNGLPTVQVLSIIWEDNNSVLNNFKKSYLLMKFNIDDP